MAAKQNQLKAMVLNYTEVEIYLKDNNGGMEIEKAIVNPLFWSSTLQTAPWQ